MPPFTPNEFIDWLREAGKTRTFWTKPIAEISFEKLGNMHLFRIGWLSRGKIEYTQMIIAPQLEKHHWTGRSESILILPKGSEPPEYDQHSCVYLWELPSRTLEPNTDVKVEKYETWSSQSVFREIQRRSWGFYVLPRKGDHLVLVAILSGRPVGLTYLNVKNFNLDYGVHVVRDKWRRRIGTRLLVEAMDLAKEMGSKYLTMFRWLRRKLDSRDRAAISFYEANNPRWSYMTYRML